MEAVTMQIAAFVAIRKAAEANLLKYTHKWSCKDKHSLT